MKILVRSCIYISFLILSCKTKIENIGLENIDAQRNYQDSIINTEKEASKKFLKIKGLISEYKEIEKENGNSFYYNYYLGRLYSYGITLPFDSIFYDNSKSLMTNKSDYINYVDSGLYYSKIALTIKPENIKSMRVFATILFNDYINLAKNLHEIPGLLKRRPDLFNNYQNILINKCTSYYSNDTSKNKSDSRIILEISAFLLLNSSQVINSESTDDLDESTINALYTIGEIYSIIKNFNDNVTGAYQKAGGITKVIGKTKMELIKKAQAGISGRFIKGKCFLLTNLYGSGISQQQFKRLISFNEIDNTCTFSIVNATYNKLASRELDGRTKGKWRIENDKLLIEWEGFYVSRKMGASDSDGDFFDDESGKSLKLKREILGEYKIEITNGELKLYFLSEIVRNAELDEFLNYERNETAEREFAYTLPFNDNTNAAAFTSVECPISAEALLTKDFVPQKNQSDMQIERYNQEYNISHSCSDQKSFDAGYDLAREQIGNGLLANDDYLYQLAKSTGIIYNYYCFAKGVNQYIKEHRNR